MAVRIAKNPTKKGNRYFYDCYVDGERHRSKLYATKKEAKEAEVDFTEDWQKKDAPKRPPRHFGRVTKGNHHVPH